MSYTQFGKSDTVSIGVLERASHYPEKTCIVSGTKKQAGIIMRYLIQHIFDNKETRDKFVIQPGESEEAIRRDKSKDRVNFRLPDGTLGEVFVISSEGKRTNDVLDAVMGFGADNVIADESSLMSDIENMGILRMIGGVKKPFFLKIGNPFRRNHFLKSALDPSYKHIVVDYHKGIEEGRISQEFIDEVKDNPMFSVLYECKFPDADTVDDKGYQPLILEEDFHRSLVDLPEMYGIRKLGSDIAGGGKDTSVIVRRGNAGGEIVYSEKTPDTMTFVAEAQKQIERYRNYEDIVEFAIDKVGLGKGAYDLLREIYMGKSDVSIVGVVAGAKAEEERYYNKKAEMAFRARAWLLAGGKLKKDERFKEIFHVKFKTRSDRKLFLKTKQELLSEKIKSPDHIEAFFHTFYTNDSNMVVKKRSDQTGNESVDHMERDMTRVWG